MTLYDAVRPFLFRMDAEDAHGLAIKALQSGLIPCPAPPVRDPALEMVLWDRKFSNPVGLAAGFDKHADVIAPMLRFGFGFVEVGTVTPKPQPGNARPRIFRDPASRSIINRVGFPSHGADHFRAQMEKFLSRRPRPSGVVGINIGMNRDQAEPAKDYRLLVRMLGPLADYLTVNISSPSTPGIRDLQKRENLLPLLAGIMEERARSCGATPPPLLVKLAPDLPPEDQPAIAATLTEAGADGVILTNTAFWRPPPGTVPPAFAAQKGGLSGPLMKDLSTRMIRNFYSLTGGALPIIGVGGIGTAADAYEKIRAGASLIQLYTALVYHGPGVVHDINTGLLELMRRDGFARLGDAVGADHGKTARHAAGRDSK